MVLSAALRVLLERSILAPTAFLDELGYQKLAQSIGRGGGPALLGNDGLSYPPLYPVVLAPIHALDASGHAAYWWAKAVNAVLMSLSVVPIYRIARFALPRRESLVAAALSVAAPLMLVTSFVLSENLAYPLSLLAVWAMLSTLRTPSSLGDALVLIAISAAAAARPELLVLLPAALTAVALTGALAQEPDGLVGAVVRELRRHPLLVAACVAAMAGAAAFLIFESPDLPGIRGFVEQVVWHVAALDLMLGVVPFVGAIVAAYAYFRSGDRAAHLPFAAVALSVTGWVLLEVGAIEGSGSEPALHERYLIYVVPLFVIALLATTRLVDSKPLRRVSLLAVLPAALLPAAVPFGDALGFPHVVDTFGLQPFGRIHDGELQPVEHVVPLALLTCGLFGVAYGVVRNISGRALVLVALIAFVSIGTQAHGRLRSASRIGRVALPLRADWVDRAAQGHEVVLVADDSPEGSATASLETAFFNTSIARVYTVCDRTFGDEFGEQHLDVRRSGRLGGPAGEIRARLAVVPDAWELRGDVLATNARGGQVLLRLVQGVIGVPTNKRAGVTCA